MCFFFDRSQYRVASISLDWLQGFALSVSRPLLLHDVLCREDVLELGDGERHRPSATASPAVKPLEDSDAASVCRPGLV